jgi:hypothetical protein
MWKKHLADEQHAVLVLNIVISRSVVDYEVLAAKVLDVVKKAALVVANLSKHKN